MSVPDDVREAMARAICRRQLYSTAWERLNKGSQAGYRLDVDAALSALEAAGWELNRKGTREALEPFARAAEALNEYDPEFPDDGSILRMSAEWYMRTHKAGEQLNKPLTAGDLRAVAALLPVFPRWRRVMKALTIWQPWASLIMLGFKDYEFRPWAAPRSIVGQRIVIHAGARKAREDEIMEIITGDSESCWPCRPGSHRFDEMEEFLQRVRRGQEKLPVSAGLGTVILGTPKRATELTPGDDRVREDMWGWPVSEPVLFSEPIVARGAQGFWNWAPEPDFFRSEVLAPSSPANDKGE